MSWQDILKKRAEKNRANEVKVAYLGKGKTSLRILPNATDPDVNPFWQDYGEHWIKSTEKTDSGRNKIISVSACVSKAYEQDCPYCSVINEAFAYMKDNEHNHSDEEMALISEAKSKRRILINAAVRTSKSGDYEVRLISLPSTAFDGITAQVEEWGGALVRDKGGRDIVIERSGEGINTSYSVTVTSDANAGKDIDDSWTDQAIDLDSFVKGKIDTPERLESAMKSIAQLAGVSMSTFVAIEAPAPKSRHEGIAVAAPVASPAPKVIREEVEVEDAVFQLDDDMIDEIEASIVESAPFEIDEADAPVEKKKTASQIDDDDLLAELDDLDI